MANLAKIIGDIATISKIDKFLSSLKHSDLPQGWQEDPAIVDAAGKLYREMGTDSPFFKAWFGDSKAVDAGGNPITAYHGTNKDFDTFSKDKISPFGQYGGNKFFFTGDENVARGYGDNTINAFLKAEYGLPEKRAARQAGEALKEINYIHPANDPRDIWAVSEPTQIKSTANRGTFDPNDPNILRTAAPWLAGGGLASGAMLGGGNAQATPLSPEMSAWAKGAEKAQALEEPVWNPADLLAAPIGAVGVPARAAAMALDAPVTLALNEVLDYISNAGKNAAGWWRK